VAVVEGPGGTVEVDARPSDAMRCTHVLSEDLSDGRDYGVRVTNPFR
jgi:hypothetical protein